MAEVVIGAGTGRAPLTAASISLASLGSVAAIAAIAGQTARVYRIALTANAATSVVFQDGGNVLTGPMFLAAGVPLVLDISGQPWFNCSQGNPFYITNQASTTIGGILHFTQQ